jgi:hypothetical protein
MEREGRKAVVYESRDGTDASMKVMPPLGKEYTFWYITLFSEVMQRTRLRL